MSKFKKSDKVFDIRYGWGEVIDVDVCLNYPVIVEFDIEEMASISYTLEGFSYKNGFASTLSFTEYTLEGFRQERPVTFKKGEWIAVRDNESNSWEIRKFIEMEGKFFICKHSDPSLYPVKWKYAKKLNDFNQ